MPDNPTTSNPEPKGNPCTCHFLHEAATNPDSPIVFDAELNEFHIGTLSGYSMVYYCPICGGSAPKSLRGDLFGNVTEAENARLSAVTKSINSERGMIEELGPPDEERRTFLYKNLSDVAGVWGLIVNGEWKGMSFHRKQVKFLRDTVRE